MSRIDEERLFSPIYIQVLICQLTGNVFEAKLDGNSLHLVHPSKHEKDDAVIVYRLFNKISGTCKTIS